MSDNKKESHSHTHDIWTDIPIFSKLYELYKTLTDCILRFPKTKRYTLGQKLDSTTLELFELLISLPHAEKKLTVLNRMSMRVDLLKVLLRLAKDSQSMQNTHYVQLQAQLQEIGRMLGGWIRSTKQTSQ